MPLNLDEQDPHSLRVEAAKIMQRDGMDKSKSSQIVAEMNEYDLRDFILRNIHLSDLV